jgi:hypothetical protein
MAPRHAERTCEQMTDKDEGRAASVISDRAFWTATRVTAAAMTLAGAVGAIGVVVAHDGFGAAAQAQLVTFGALILLGVGALFAPSSADSGGVRAVQTIFWMIAALALVNVALAWIDLDAWTWRAPAYFPFTQPIGTDFRNGGYAAAQHFSNATSGWPPLTVILFAPYLLLGPDAAYVVHVCILVAATTAALRLALSVARTEHDDDIAPGSHTGAYLGQLAPAFAIWLFISYGFLLSIERGSLDAFVAFLAMLGLWAMVKRPYAVWLPTIAFSVAAELKVYPALLLLLVVWRFRWRSVVPLVACNVVLALSAGPRNLLNFYRNGTRMTAQGADWVGNSSAQSFSAWVDWIDPRYLPHLPVLLLLATPAALLLVGAWRLRHRRDHAATVLMLCAMVPVMCLLPSISHDYKVVLFTGPAVLLVSLLLRHVGRGSSEPWWMLLTLCLALFFIARAPGQLVDYTPNVQRFVWPAVLMNKYPAILLFEVVTVWMAWRLPRPAVPDSARRGPTPSDSR